jgi:hypothetical protein
VKPRFDGIAPAISSRLTTQREEDVKGRDGTSIASAAPQVDRANGG